MSDRRCRRLWQISDRRIQSLFLDAVCCPHTHARALGLLPSTASPSSSSRALLTPSLRDAVGRESLCQLPEAFIVLGTQVPGLTAAMPDGSEIELQKTRCAPFLSYWPGGSGNRLHRLPPCCVVLPLCVGALGERRSC